MGIGRGERVDLLCGEGFPICGENFFAKFGAFVLYRRIMDKKESAQKLILASASPRRRQILSKAGFDFDMVVSDAEEVSNLAPEKLVEFNALAKARAVARKYPERLVLGADTIVALGGKVFGKPRDLDEAFGMLAQLRGREHEVWTAAAFVKNSGGKLREVCGAQVSKVKFRNLSDGEVREYLRVVNVLDKAGAYAAQEHGGMIIENIDGDFDNVMGLPMRLVKNLLDKLDF